MGRLPRGHPRWGSKAKTGAGGLRGWTGVLGGWHPAGAHCGGLLGDLSQPCVSGPSSQGPLRPQHLSSTPPEELWQLPQAPEVGLLPEGSTEAPSAGGQEPSAGVLSSERSLKFSPHYSPEILASEGESHPGETEADTSYSLNPPPPMTPRSFG